jgi:hypothetical protein
VEFRWLRIQRLTLCPPKALRKAASIFSAKDSSCLERNLVKSAAVNVGTGTS